VTTSSWLKLASAKPGPDYFLSVSFPQRHRYIVKRVVAERVLNAFFSLDTIMAGEEGAEQHFERYFDRAYQSEQSWRPNSYNSIWVGQSVIRFESKNGFEGAGCVEAQMEILCELIKSQEIDLLDWAIVAGSNEYALQDIARGNDDLSLAQVLGIATG
jgi:hypothetical protein